MRVLREGLAIPLNHFEHRRVHGVTAEGLLQAAQLNHPNIITIYDFIEDEGNLYIVMELLDGKDLKELIKSGAPLTMEQIFSMMEQIQHDGADSA